MVLHLEAGTCESGADSDRVTEIAFDCYQSGKYTCDDNSEFDFECPTCNTPFTWMSGLLQHVESDSCDEQLAKRGPSGASLEAGDSLAQAISRVARDHVGCTQTRSFQAHVENRVGLWAVWLGSMVQLGLGISALLPASGA